MKDAARDRFRSPRDQGPASGVERSGPTRGMKTAVPEFECRYSSRGLVLELWPPACGVCPGGKVLVAGDERRQSPLVVAAVLSEAGAIVEGRAQIACIHVS